VDVIPHSTVVRNLLGRRSDVVQGPDDIGRPSAGMKDTTLDIPRAHGAMT